MTPPEPRPTPTANDGVPASVTNPAPQPPAAQPPPVNSLTPEEQMALFEKELKEQDWGHQPC